MTTKEKLEPCPCSCNPHCGCQCHKRAPSLTIEAVEIVAAECHKQWAGWAEYMMAKLSEDWDAWAPRWRRQIATAYADLSEQEKESDRVEARKILAALAAYRQEKDNGI